MHRLRSRPNCQDQIQITKAALIGVLVMFERPPLVPPFKTRDAMPLADKGLDWWLWVSLVTTVLGLSLLAFAVVVGF